MRTIILTILVTTSLFASASDRPDYKLIKSYEIYDIYGSTPEELEESFVKQKPRALVETGFDATTDWDYDMSYDTNTCRATDLTLYVDFTLPIIHTSKLTDEVKKNVTEYTNAIYAHEQVHCSLIIEKINSMYDKVRKGEKGDCDEYYKKVSDEITNSINKVNKEFDRSTDHGRKPTDFSKYKYMNLCKFPF
ncbi:DUF922 domain-containing protein [Vibrio harveyi]|uniref:DUF922 domain-containing protein n=1 Tax=Vibrio harveyi TaxID=669 RepID=UPI0005773955|nr:DUF922 domain-containing protein [Vibrio harveyi]MBY7699339.1 DUF922 domain-containing protein [Vibrio harveyi]PNM62567.1 DUF922 domain-containing protein [Vibrio harveyi]UIL56474.1 DUF922 domain-containing Zn-dependent protease [Vibrio harveyi]SQA36253.1 Predicted secreted Zn-dependent protease [Vibrio harveyi]